MSAPSLKVSLLGSEVRIVVGDERTVEPASLYVDAFVRGCIVDDLRAAARADGLAGVETYVRESGFSLRPIAEAR